MMENRNHPDREVAAERAISPDDRSTVTLPSAARKPTWLEQAIHDVHARHHCWRFRLHGWEETTVFSPDPLALEEVVSMLELRFPDRVIETVRPGGFR